MRFTNLAIEATARRLIIHRYSDAIYEARIAERVLFMRAYDHLYNAEERTLINTAPAGFFAKVAALRTSVGGQWHTLRAKGEDFGVCSYALHQEQKDELSVLPGVLVAAIHDGGSPAALQWLADAPGLPQDIVAHAVLLETLKATVQGAEKQAQHALRSFPTVERARREWPEVAPFLPKGSIPSNLPAVAVADLNALFELPAEEGATP